MDSTATHRRIGLATTLAIALAAGSGVGWGADPWPVKPVRLIVPYAAGGTGDIIGRMVGGKLTEVIGQTVIVENRPGAGGNIGAEATVRVHLFKARRTLAFRFQDEALA